MPEMARRVRPRGGTLGSLGTLEVGTLGLLSGCGVGLACWRAGVPGQDLIGSGSAEETSHQVVLESTA